MVKHMFDCTNSLLHTCVGRAVEGHWGMLASAVSMEGSLVGKEWRELLDLDPAIEKIYDYLVE